MLANTMAGTPVEIRKIECGDWRRKPVALDLIDARPVAKLGVSLMITVIVVVIFAVGFVVDAIKPLDLSKMTTRRYAN